MTSFRSQVAIFLGLILLVGLGVFSLSVLWLNPKPVGQAPAYPKATYTSADSCVQCHQHEHNLWSGSHHDLAMQPANEDTVLGDFDQATFTHFGVTSTFFKKDGQYFVNTDGPDGQLRDFPIAYTFGVTPLQQYLIAFPDGRYQALGICWDSRPESQGGQRWYHLYPDEPIPHDDSLHWTGPNQNWNFMCAECHSTNLQKNYDLKSNTFNTTWSHINVSCEACHGPGSNHLLWAQRNERGLASNDPDMGLAFRMIDDGGTWQFQPGSDTAQRSIPRQADATIDMCARCHSRRSAITLDYTHGQSLLDTHQPELIRDNLYHPDGQIRDEVYVYGSFLQSKMYHSGVTCTDCHNPHSMRVYSNDNALCASCHRPDTFDTPDHHFHEQGTRASRCVECHMPTKTYMGIDARLDHSIRVPRPDLSIKLGTPNACNHCHADQSPQWAQDAIVQWYGTDRSNQPHFGPTFHAAENAAPRADQSLADFADDMTQPDIVRASAIALLRNYPTPLAYTTTQRYADNQDPMIRHAALSALEMSEPSLRIPVAFKLLNDPVRSVRLEAARVLAPVPASRLTPEQQQAIDEGIEAYIQSQLTNADRAESHLNIALVHTQRGHADLAEQSYRTAIRVNPGFAQAYVNLADLYRSTDRDEQALQLLRDAVDAGMKQGVVHYALGLALVRHGQAPDAIHAFRQAAELQPDDPQFGYTLGIALNSTGQPNQALAALVDTHLRHPKDLSTLHALMTISHSQHDLDAALRYAHKLVELNPPNLEPIRAFIVQIKKQQEAQPR